MSEQGTKAYKNLSPCTLLAGNLNAMKAVTDWAKRHRFSQQATQRAIAASQTIGEAKAFLADLRRRQRHES